MSASMPLSYWMASVWGGGDGGGVSGLLMMIRVTGGVLSSSMKTSLALSGSPALNESHALLMASGSFSRCGCLTDPFCCSAASASRSRNSERSCLVLFMAQVSSVQSIWSIQAPKAAVSSISFNSLAASLVTFFTLVLVTFFALVICLTL